MVNINTHKIHKYLKNKCDEMIQSTRSNYYKFGTHIIRLSDHIGKNSSGTHSIIIDKRDNYVVHAHAAGTIVVMNYEEIKRFIATVTLINDFQGAPNLTWEKEGKPTELIKENQTLKRDLQKINDKMEKLIKIEDGMNRSIFNYRQWFRDQGIDDPFAKKKKKITTTILEIPENVFEIA